MLRHLLGMSEAAFLAHDRDPVPPQVAARFEALVDRRASGVPAAHLTGEREFWGRDFAVDDRVLVPRPETEHLVEIALALPLGPRARVLDLGTGSGCLAVSLAAERPDWSVVAADLSPAALAVALGNARRHLADRPVMLAASDLARALRLQRFDLVVSNPPYVALGLRPSLAAEVRDHDPALALHPPGAELSLVERLLDECRELAEGAWLAVEVGAGQVPASRAIAERIGGWHLERVERDLAGHERDLLWRRRG